MSNPPCAYPLQTLPLLPLLALALSPDTTLPLHVFEPRYRELLRDALAGERLIGMQTLDEEAASDPAGPPRVLPIGCAWEIVEHHPLEDGRSNILLRGLFRYRIERELAGRSYRRAEVSVLPLEPLPLGDLKVPGRRDLRRLLSRLVAKLEISVGREGARELDPSLSDEGLVNEALSRLGLSAKDRYRLLELNRLEERYAETLERVVALQRRLDLLAPHRRPVFDPRMN